MLDADLGVGYVVQALSTGETWEVREEPGFFPALIADWEAALLDERRVAPDEKAELVAVNEAAQWNWVRLELLPSRPADHYHVRRLDTVDLPAPLHTATRTDVVNRRVPAAIDVVGAYDGDLNEAAPSRLVADPSGAWQRRYLDGAPHRE
jgi:hypothetical protein